MSNTYNYHKFMQRKVYKLQHSQIKLKAAYILAILVCIAVIPTAVNKLAKSIVIENNIKIALILSNSLVFLTIGLIFFCFSILILNYLWTYQVGKLFSLYLMIISICILLINMPLPYKTILLPVHIMAVSSNVILYNLIGRLTFLNQKKVYKICRVILILFTLIQFAASISGYGNRKFIIYIKNYFLTVNYIFTVLLILIYLMAYYRQITHYTKKQFKLLLFGLILGIIGFLLYSLTPIIAFIKVSHNQEMHLYINSAEAASAVLLNRDVQSVIMFTGIVGVIIYILIKREYLIEIHREFLHIISGILYMIVINILLFYSYNPLIPVFYYLFNIVVALPLLLIYIKSKSGQSEIYNMNLIKSLEEERQRISTYLHDEVLQDLIAIYHKDENNHQLASLISDIRNLSHDLYPIIVEDLGLEQSLAMFIEDLTIDHNIDIDFKYLFPAGVIPNYIAVTVYRTVKELVINAVKHANCEKITVQISEDQNFISIMVEDNGKGFVIKENSKLLKSPHMGLYTVKKQIENLKGQFRLQSNIGKGTRYDINIPLTEGWRN